MKATSDRAFEGLEMDHHAGEVRELLESLPLGGPGHTVYKAGLTAREVEVLRLD